MSHRILLAEDEPQTLEVMQLTLKEFAFELESAKSGLLERTDEFSPDLVVVSDTFEQGEAFQQLVSQRPELPVLLVASSEEPPPAQRVLFKPFSPMTLLAEVHRMLGIELT